MKVIKLKITSNVTVYLTKNPLTNFIFKYIYMLLFIQTPILFQYPPIQCTHVAQKILRLSIWQTAKIIHLPDRKPIHLPDGKKTTAWHFLSSINSQINPYLLSPVHFLLRFLLPPKLNTHTLQPIQYLLHCCIDIFIRKCPVLGSKGNGIGNGLISGDNLAAFINIKQLAAL